MTASALLCSLGPQREAFRPSELLISRGEGELPLVIPRGEKLQFDVLLRLGILPDTKVGEFELEAGVEPYLPAPAMPIEASSTLPEVGFIKGHTGGQYLTYELDHSIEMRVLPQSWPRILYRDTQKGTENRRRELSMGARNGEHLSEYRSDGHCDGCKRPGHFNEGTWFTKSRHCKKCKRGEHRIWGDTHLREIPEGTLDMLSSIYLSRSLIRSGLDEISFPLLDRKDLWELTVRRGKQKKLKVGAGRFLCREVLLSSGVPEAEAATREAKDFKGLFGIHGTIHIWLEERTGVPVMIEGIVPVGPIDLDVYLELKSYEGTPEDFVPLE
jgi:hypothetical protein